MHLLPWPYPSCTLMPRRPVKTPVASSTHGVDCPCPLSQVCYHTIQVTSLKNENQNWNLTIWMFHHFLAKMNLKILNCIIEHEGTLDRAFYRCNYSYSEVIRMDPGWERIDAPTVEEEKTKTMWGQWESSCPQAKEKTLKRHPTCQHLHLEVWASCAVIKSVTVAYITTCVMSLEIPYVPNTPGFASLKSITKSTSE